MAALSASSHDLLLFSSFARNTSTTLPYDDIVYPHQSSNTGTMRGSFSIFIRDRVSKEAVLEEFDDA